MLHNLWLPHGFAEFSAGLPCRYYQRKSVLNISPLQTSLQFPGNIFYCIKSGIYFTGEVIPVNFSSPGKQNQSLNKKTKGKKPLVLLVPWTGLEPARAMAHYPLKIACLPIPPPRLKNFHFELQIILYKL